MKENNSKKLIKEYKKQTEKFLILKHQRERARYNLEFEKCKLDQSIRKNPKDFNLKGMIKEEAVKSIKILNPSIMKLQEIFMEINKDCDFAYYEVKYLEFQIELTLKIKKNNYILEEKN